MNRSEAVVFISDRLGEYLSAADREASDAAGKTLRPVIDDALRAIGWPMADLATAVVLDAERITDLEVQAIYRALLQLNRDLGATMINTSVGGDSFSLQSIRAAAREDLAQAAEMVLARFNTLEIVGEGSSSDAGFIDLNFLAPVALI